MVMSLSGGIVNSFLNFNGGDFSDATYGIWNFIFAILVASWAVKDSQKSGEIVLDWGMTFYILWPISALIWLQKTRGIDGLVMYFGIWCIYLLPWIMGLVTYTYYT